MKVRLVGHIHTSWFSSAFVFKYTSYLVHPNNGEYGVILHLLEHPEGKVPVSHAERLPTSPEVFFVLASWHRDLRDNLGGSVHHVHLQSFGEAQREPCYLWRDHSVDTMRSDAIWEGNTINTPRELLLIVL